MTTVKTPGSMYVVHQRFPDLVWQVVSVPEAQGRGMMERDEPNVYETSAQAYAVAKRLETARLSSVRSETATALRGAMDRYGIAKDQLSPEARRILNEEDR